jgi:hypothetical protein
MQSKATHRPRLDRIDRQRSAVDAPARPHPHVLVVIAQVPHQIAVLPVGDGPVVRNAGDAAERVIALVAGSVDLADNRVFGSGDGGQRRHRGAHTVTSVMAAHRLQRPWRVGQPQFRSLGEQFEYIIEAPVVDRRGIQVNQVAERQPVERGQAHGVHGCPMLLRRMISRH